MGGKGDHGGAARLNRGIFEVNYCYFRDNEASLEGGAVFLWKSEFIFSNCEFQSGKAVVALASSYSEGSFISCKFVSNSATSEYTAIQAIIWWSVWLIATSTKTKLLAPVEGLFI